MMVGQTAVYHLHSEASTIVKTSDKLLVAGPDTTTKLLTTTLTNKVVGHYLVKEFETQTGVPNAAGVIPSGSTFSFSLWMRKTANFGTAFPEARVRLNSATGTAICTAIGTTALTTTVAKLNVSCTSAANITMTTADRFYLWVGVNLTAVSSSTFSGELDIEGTLNANFDSQITVPLGTGVPTVSSLAPSSGASGSSVVISGSNFRSAPVTGSVVKFNGVAATSVPVWSTGSITAVVPTGLALGAAPVVVTVGGQSSTAASFNVTAPPSISSLTPSAAAPGSTVTIVGANFNIQAADSTVTFGGGAASIVTWTSGVITVKVPPTAATGNVVVTAAGGVSGTGVPFTVTGVPGIASLTPNAGAVLSTVTIVGTNFNAQGADSKVMIGTVPAPIINWTTNTIKLTVPSTAISSNVVVTAAGGVASSGVPFTVTPAPSISGLTPNTGAVSSTITISGANFNAQAPDSAVTFGGVQAAIIGWTSNTITATVPLTATTGNVVVTAAGGVSGPGVPFAVTPAPSISSLSPNTGASTSTVTIAGANFNAQGADSKVMVGTVPAPIINWTTNSIKVSVPSTATTGSVVVTAAGGVSSPGVPFTLTPAPTISSLTPNTGAGTSTVTIAGANFNTQGPDSAVTFGGAPAAITGWNSNTITVTVPPAATTGNVVVTAAGGVSSPGVPFTVTPAPSISILGPNTGAVSSTVTIAGANFNTQAPDSAVTFGGVSAAIAGWNSNTITVTVPPTATTGNVVVTAGGGVSSPGVPFTVTPAPSISILGPNTGAVSSTVAIAGANFNTPAPDSAVTFGGVPAAITGWNSNTITVTVPPTATTGNVVVTAAGGVSSPGVPFTVTPAPSISSLAPNTGAVSSSVTISGANFNAQAPDSAVTFGGVPAAIIGWASNTITATVPPTATTGSVVVTAAGGVASPGVPFSVTPAPSITSLTPNAGAVTSTVTIAGANFNAQAADSTVTFGGVPAAITGWTNSTITVTVPPTATTGNVVVTAAGGVPSPGVPFTVGTPAPLTITASSTPAANAAGWNNSDVTITFTCSGSTGVLNCPVPITVTSEGANQVINGTVSDSLGNSANTSVTLSIDKTAPTLAITGPSNGSIVSTASVKITGTLLDALSGIDVSTVTCNGFVASIQQPNFTCSVRLVSGANAIQLQARDMAGNSVADSLNVTLPEPSGIFLTPMNLSMLVGDSRNIRLVGQLGQIVSGAVFTVSDPAILSVSSDPPQVVGVGPGTASLTATLGPLTAKANITVFAGASLPLGAAVWSVSPLDVSSVRSILHGDTSDPTHPSVYALSDSTIYALGSDGQLLWTASNDVSDPSFQALSAVVPNQSSSAGTQVTPSVPQAGRTVVFVASGTSAGVGASPTNPTGLPPDHFLSALGMLEFRLRAEAKKEVVPGPKTRALQNFLNIVNLQATTIPASRARLVAPRGRLTSSLQSEVTVRSGSSPLNAAASVLEGVVATIEDSNDGLLHLIAGLDPISFNMVSSSLLRRDPVTGLPSWRYDSPGLLWPQFAVHPDGTIFLMEFTPVVMTQQIDGLTWRNTGQVVALDGTTGVPKFTISIPTSHLGDINVDDCLCDHFESFRAAKVGRIIVGVDGAAYVAIHQGTAISDGLGQANNSHVLELLKILPDGSSTTIPIHSFSGIQPLVTMSEMATTDNGIVLGWGTASGDFQNNVFNTQVFLTPVDSLGAAGADVSVPFDSWQGQAANPQIDPGEAFALATEFGLADLATADLATTSPFLGPQIGNLLSRNLLKNSARHDKKKTCVETMSSCKPECSAT